MTMNCRPKILFFQWIAWFFLVLSTVPCNAVDDGFSRAATLGGKDIFYAPSGIMPQQRTGASLVPEREWMSHVEAMTLLAELYLRTQKPEHLRRVSGLLDIIETREPRPTQARILRIRLASALGRRHEVRALADQYLENEEFQPAAFIEIADIHASLGWFDRCRDIYLTVLDRVQGDDRDRLELQYAERTILWGDFNAGEAVFREALRKDEGNDPLRLQLARNLMAQQRFEEARNHLERILRTEDDRKTTVRTQAMVDWINTGLLEKDLDRAAADMDEVAARHGFPGEILLTGAKAYLEAGRLEDARELYLDALSRDEYRVGALMGLGAIALRMGEGEEAARYFQMVEENPEAYPPARAFYLSHEDEMELQRHVEEFVREGKDPAGLWEMGQVLAAQGFFQWAVMCFDAALEVDEEYFPAKISLSEIRGAMGQYVRALEILEPLMEDFPGNYKIGLTRARILAWSRDYSGSLEAYGDLHRKNPDNPLILRESARTAYWGKMADRGDELYTLLYTPAVDALLLERLKGLRKEVDLEWLDPPMSELGNKVDQGSVYEGYEDFFTWFHNRREGDGIGERGERILDVENDLRPVYQVHRRADMEQKAKNLAWNRRFAPAGRQLTDLTAFDPGNREALFDLARTHCALGLCDQEKLVYEQLLRLDPLHGQAARALHRQKVRSMPLVKGAYDFWREAGRGDLARITRHRLDLGLEIPVFCRHGLKLTTHRYFELPTDRADRVQASGVSLEGELVAGPHLSLAGGISHKFYDGSMKVENFTHLAPGTSSPDAFKTPLKNITAGYFRASANLDNYATLLLGYETVQEQANVMALAQGITSNRFKARLDMFPSRKLDLALEAEYIRYSDDNQGHNVGMELGYAFTDHPRMFKAVLSGRYRDTDRAYQGCSGPGACSITDDFRHPYWTPQNHWETAITVEFRHDLAKDFFCGAREHFYDLKVTVGTERNRNDSIELRALWQKEITDRTGFRVEWMWHNSKEWDAMGGNVAMFMRF